MLDRELVYAAIADMRENREQHDAIHEMQHCVVLAGPGSGKTKTLTAAIARALLDDVFEPRGVACITYNNECALELEGRLAKLGIEPSSRIFIGTVHGFALSQVISPYARCVLPELPPIFRVATEAERRGIVEDAYKTIFGSAGDPHQMWRFAVEKRLRQVNRDAPSWRGRNPELARFVEEYERQLHAQGLIDFDDMPLLAYRMIAKHRWIAEALEARFPVLFVDEYQDLGHALHELVLKLCFDGRMRLFAVGDVDQSIYAFTGANPQLLAGLAERPDVKTYRLRFNYRSGTTIINASMAALGEDRGYVAPNGTSTGVVEFRAHSGDTQDQARDIAENLVPQLIERGFAPEEIAILYREASLGSDMALALAWMNLPFVRADNQALVKRSSRLARFVEACARWVTGGWKEANPLFRRLADEAVNLVKGPYATNDERHAVHLQLIEFLQKSIGVDETAHLWLIRLRDTLITPWAQSAADLTEDWKTIDLMIERTASSSPNENMPLAHLGGRIEGGGRINLSTLHSAKGREFDAVILFAMNSDVIPSWRDRTPEAVKEARRLFYVGVTRPRKELHVCFRAKQNSPWVKELFDRLHPSS
ncbi:ATP-dependent helicase [Noviherbaspirillum sp. UKPF54]|uniref:ATP-dependent helicase n=1 Tax=Noviherbaspirillum sp. UKPF54 TaxID=2601898 RepID=UPI0011B1B22E|nr:ATP-dependent helicase [Noviherbaspirillum sp. UKPF54]QDZ29575.1 ATP-dependent helicase [Noviherbaspirillum sp. UKPF54]